MDNVSPARRSEIMARVRSKDTGPELIVRRLVHALGYRYRLHRIDLPGKPDMVFVGRRKVVFVHGCFWHGHRGCARARIPAANRQYWDTKIARNKARDRERTNALRRAHWGVLTLWECQLRDARQLERRIRSFIDG
jgi:DNA mismatch endonuclease (patch repair protein)